MAVNISSPIFSDLPPNKQVKMLAKFKFGSDVVDLMSCKKHTSDRVKPGGCHWSYQLCHYPIVIVVKLRCSLGMPNYIYTVLADLCFYITSLG